MGVLVWFSGAVIAFLAAQLLGFGRFHPIAELLVSCSGGLTAGLAATWLDFGGFGEADFRAFLFTALVAFLSIGITRLGVTALRWPSHRSDADSERGTVSASHDAVSR